MNEDQDQPDFVNPYTASNGDKKEHVRQYDKFVRSAFSKKVYHSMRWRKLRAAVLHANPLCTHCLKGSVTRLASAVDHILPLDTHPSLAFERSNLQGLCHYHHSLKTLKDKHA